MFWIARRVATSLALVLLIASIVFLAIHLVPGDPATSLLTQGGSAPTPGQVEALRTRLGLDRPVLEQFTDSILGLFRADLGQSMQDGSDVLAEILKRLPRTLELIAAAALLAVAIGLPLGFLAALRQGSWFDRAANAFAALAQSIPVFVIGTVMVMYFAQKLRWLPAGGYVPLAENPARHFLLLMMPAFAIAVDLSGTVLRMTRAAVLDVMQKEYVRTARAKGLTEGPVQRRHVIRNALIPIVTVVALHSGNLLGGTVLVEYVFNWPGLSGLLVEAVNGRDYPMVVGAIIVISSLFVTLNLLVDIIYGFLDPRIRAQ